MRETLVKPLYVDNIDLPSNKALRISSTTDPTGTKDLTIERASSATAKLTDGAGGVAKWSATSGGTGLTGFAVGDLLYADTTTTLARLAVGANGTFLKLAAGVPTWAAAASTTLAAVLATGNTTGGTSLVVSSGDPITGADSTTGGAFPDRAGNGSAGAGGLRSVSGGNGVGTNQNAGGFTASSGNSSGTGTAGVGIFTAPVGSSGSGTNTAVRQWHFSSTSTAANLTAVSTGHLGWASSTDPIASPVVGLTYAASSVLKVTNGTTGWGGMIASGVALGSAVTSSQAAAAGQVRCYNGSNVLQSFMSTGIGLASANLIYWTASDASASGDTAQGRVSAGVWGLTNGSDSNYYFVCGNATGARIRSGDQFSFSSSATIAGSAADTGLARAAAGILRVSDGSTGYSTLAVSTIAPVAIAGTNQAGTAHTTSGGLGTGTGVPGPWIAQTGFVGASGSTAHVAAHRIYVGTKTLALTDNTAATFAQISIASGAHLAGHAFLAIRIFDGTDYQVLNSIMGFCAVNKGGTITVNAGQLNGGPNITAVSAGTVNSLGLSATSGASLINLRIQCDSSLTVTVMDVTYTIFLQTPGVVTPA